LAVTSVMAPEAAEQEMGARHGPGHVQVHGAPVLQVGHLRAGGEDREEDAEGVEHAREDRLPVTTTESMAGVLLWWNSSAFPKSVRREGAVHDVQVEREPEDHQEEGRDDQEAEERVACKRLAPGIGRPAPRSS